MWFGTIDSDRGSTTPASSGSRLPLAMSDPVIYELRGASARLTIDRENRRNVLSDDVIAGLLGGLERAESDEAVRVVVLTGAGDRAFSAGGDLAGNLGPSEGRVQSHDRRGLVAGLLTAIAAHPQPA